MMLAWSVNDVVVSAMDVVLGWSLHFSQGTALVAVALATSLVLTFVRVVSTDQKYLKCCRKDRKRLKQLLRQAKRDKDRQAVKRHRATLGMLGAGTMKAEFKPLLASIVPIILLATWAFARLSFVPPQPGDDLTVKAYFPMLSVGRLAHIVGQDGLEARDGWVRIVQEDLDQAGNATNGLASWTIHAARRDRPYVLQIRHGGRTVESQLIIDGYRYAPQAVRHKDGGILAVEQSLAAYKPFGVIPGIGRLGIAGWVVGYLLIAIGCTLVLKRACGIC